MGLMMARGWILFAASIGVMMSSLGAGLTPQSIHAQTAADPKHLVVPGRSVGDVRLGMSLDDVKGVWGEPSYTPFYHGMQWYYFGARGPDTKKLCDTGVAVRNGKVSAARSFDPAYRTADGLGVGSTLPDLTRVHGNPNVQMSQVYVFNNVIRVNDLYVEWSMVGLSAHINKNTGHVAFIDVDTPP
jgi:hypothetical protein